MKKKAKFVRIGPGYWKRKEESYNLVDGAWLYYSSPKSEAQELADDMVPLYIRLSTVVDKCGQ